jgi:threonine/homoserine/homoserine lactone efflux protein
VLSFPAADQEGRIRQVLGPDFAAAAVPMEAVSASLDISGLAALMLSVPWLRVTLLTGSVLYLIWLAAKIAFSGSRVGFASAQSAPGFMNGVTLQLINPKAYVVNTALFTGFPFWPGSLLAETLIKFAIINLLWLPIHLAWLWFGVALRRLDLPGPVQRAINLAMAASMLAVVGLAMWSQR